MTFPPAPNPKKGTPYLTRAPWAGFSPREHARPAPLRACPSPRCRRLKHCVAAHDGLFCRRTHISHAEYLAGLPPREAWPLDTPEQAEVYRVHLEDLEKHQQARFAALTARWKAGEFDHLYGKWKAGGVLVRPPERIYKEKGR